MDEPQKFGRLAPGLPSKRLSKALGLQEDQIPSYIYRMRELGYPPGWLKEAEINHSGLELYVQQDQALPDHGDEDGEIADTDDKKQYDTSKIHDWPGFNVDMDSTKFKDETQYYRVPPMKPDHAKTKMVEKMVDKEQKGYVRGEMQDTSTTTASKNNYLEEQCTKPPGEEIIQTPAKPSKVTCIDDGTPIVQMHSPFANLPAQEKWTTNTTDHIMFENLPESTGKYENMVGVLKKIRSAKKSNQS